MGFLLTITCIKESSFTSLQALAAQVKSYEERLNKINERNEKLLEESAPGHSDQYNRLSDHDYRSSNSSLRTPVQSDTDHLDSGVFLSPTIASTTTSMYSANPHREAEKARKRSHFISSASQSSPRIVYEMAKQSSDTIHSIGSQESFDQPRLSLSQNEDNFSNLLSKQSENELNRSLSGSQKRKSRSPSPTTLCDDELIRPKSKYNTPQMLSLGPRQSSPPRREHKMGMKPMKATLKFLDPMKVKRRKKSFKYSEPLYLRYLRQTFIKNGLVWQRIELEFF